MKHKIVITLFTALFLLSLSPNIAGADNAADVLKFEQIKDIQEKIQNLHSQIASLLLQEKTTSESYVAMDISDNSVITEKNSNQIYPIASITKLMNAVVTVENIDLDKTIALDSQMLKPEGQSPSLFLHLTISARNLLQASLVQSANDAANSLTYFIGNEKFIGLMNEKAKELHMSDTDFHDACGLDPNNRSTAKDLVKLLTYIYTHHPEILSITKENNFWLPDATGKLLKFKNVNNLYDYPDFIGAKAGYIIEAKQTLASVAQINGKTIAIVLLRSANRKTDALTIVDWIKKNPSLH